MALRSRGNTNKRAQSSARLLFVLFLCLAPVYTYATLESRGPLLDQLGTAVSPAAHPASAAARIVNPASGSLLTGWNAVAGFSRSFNLPDFDRFQLSFALPLGEWTAGGWASGFGRDLYTERSLGVNASAPLLPNLFAGAGLHISQIDVKSYGSDRTFSGDLGLFWKASTFSTGLAIDDIASTSMDRFAGNGSQRQLLLSGRYSPSPTLVLMLEGVCVGKHDPSVRVGVETWLFDALAMRAGYDSSSNRFHLGVAISWQGFNAQGAYDHHPWLGWSHAFGLEWRQRPLPR